MKLLPEIIEIQTPTNKLTNKKTTMRKLLLAVAAFGMLATSCAKDETKQSDNSTVVKFVVSTPSLKTRADIANVHGTGFAAHDLEYAIYEADANGNLKDSTPEIYAEKAAAFDGNVLETTFTERLVNGKHYVVLFWADAANDPYTVDWQTQTIALTDPTSLKAQDENFDAFYKKIFFTVKSNQLEQTAELKRPFAQLNIGTSDSADAAIAGMNVAQSEIVVTTYTALNLFDGIVVGQPQELTYKMANIPSAENNGTTEGVTATLNGENYDIISMNYLFVNGDDQNDGKELVDVKFNYVDEDDATVLSRQYDLVPMKRNHRTFIVGNILTHDVDFKVIINPVFDNENDPEIYENFEVVKMEGMTAERAGYQAATLNWTAVENATKYAVMYGSTKLGETTALTYTTEPNVVTNSDTAKFIVEAYNKDGVMIAKGETSETKVFTLINRPEPAVYVADGTLVVENKVLNASEDKKSNLDLNGILLAAEVYFYKDGATTPTYTAVGTYQDTYTGANLPLSITEKKIKNNVAGSYNTWKWNGGAATKTAPDFEAGEYTIKYKAGYYAVMNASWDRTPTDRIIFPSTSDVLAEMIYREGEVAEKFVVNLNVTAQPSVDSAILKWNSAGAGATYEVYADGNKVGETTELTYNCPATLGAHDFEVKIAGSTVSASVNATVEYSIAHWTAPKFVWTGKRIRVTELTGISADGFAYAYGGDIDNNPTPAKSNIQVYNEAGTLLYTLTNGTGQGNLTSWAGYGRWALNAQDNRQDWIWTDAAGNHINIGGGEGDIDPAKMPAGKYTLKWTIGYVVSKNSTWDNSGTTVSSRAEANRIWFGPQDTKPSPNVLYTSSAKNAVTIIAKSGETTLVIE